MVFYWPSWARSMMTRQSISVQGRDSVVGVTDESVMTWRCCALPFDATVTKTPPAQSALNYQVISREHLVFIAFYRSSIPSWNSREFDVFCESSPDV